MSGVSKAYEAVGYPKEVAKAVDLSQAETGERKSSDAPKSLLCMKWLLILTDA